MNMQEFVCIYKNFSGNAAEFPRARICARKNQQHFPFFLTSSYKLLNVPVILLHFLRAQEEGQCSATVPITLHSGQLRQRSGHLVSDDPRSDEMSTSPLCFRRSQTGKMQENNTKVHSFLQISKKLRGNAADLLRARNCAQKYLQLAVVLPEKALWVVISFSG